MHDEPFNLYADVDREALRGYDERYDEDWRRDAESEHDADTTCGECGYEWWGNWTRGTRYDPPEPLNDECPRCAGLVPDEEPAQPRSPEPSPETTAAVDRALRESGQLDGGSADDEELF